MTSKPYEVVIQRNRSWFALDWQELSHYWDLLAILVRRDFISKYKQTILGPAWFLLQPLLTTGLFVVVFGKGIKLSTDGLPPVLFYLCALVPWGYFSQCLTSTSSSLISNVHILSKVYFPRLIIPLSIIVSNLMTLCIQLLMFSIFYIYFMLFTSNGIPPRGFWIAGLVPLLLLQTAMLSLGLGLWVAALTVRYRDFQHLIGFVVQLWMYATPIIYPMTIIPERWRFLMILNPMAAVIEWFRYAFFGVGFANVSYLIISFLAAVFFLTSGLFLFSRAERTFIDTI